jgi:RNA polymerase sigma factor (sigma-70 family)
MPHDAETADRAFEALYRATVGSVRAYVRRRAPESLVDDVVAHTFLIAWQKRDEALSGKLPWLYRTAGYCLANHQRAHQRQIHIAQSLDQSPAADPADRHAERSALAQALRALQPHEQEVLLLVYWEHLSIKALAVALDCRPGTAAVRLHRARRALREALSEPVRLATSVLETQT